MYAGTYYLDDKNAYFFSDGGQTLTITLLFDFVLGYSYNTGDDNVSYILALTFHAK